MKKKMTKAVVVGASLLAFAGVAQAASYQVNVAGSSAQFSFWNATAKPFLQNTYNCVVTSIKTALPDSKHGVAWSSQCGTSGTDTYVVRYASRASYDGFASLNGTQDPDGCLGFSSTDSFGNAYSCGATGGTICRKYPDEATTGTPLKCMPTILGASDVQATTLTEISKGGDLGPLTVPTATNGAEGQPTYNVYGPTGTAIHAGGKLTAINADATNLSYTNQHVAVPFAFDVNNGVTWKKCGVAGATNAQLNANNSCQTTADCNTGASETCQSTTIDNISRLQAVLLFAGQVNNWSQFGGYYDAKPVILCFRHAGSGTHATLDNAVMKSTWGKALPTNAKDNYVANGNQQTYGNYAAGANTATNSNFIWFNSGTPDEANCLDGQIYDTVAGHAVAGRGDLGAIGYLDADQADSTTDATKHYTQIKYNGVKASRQAIRNGWYDFFTMEATAYNPNDTVNYGNNSGMVTDLISYAANPANIPPTETGFWSTAGEMRVKKTSDTSYPALEVTPANPQTP
jgi:hypothetical protein